MTVYVVAQDTGGAHEPEGCWSVWDNREDALYEANRLNDAHHCYRAYDDNDLSPYGYVRAGLGKPLGSSAFYVVAVTVNESRNDNIG